MKTGLTSGLLVAVIATVSLFAWSVVSTNVLGIPYTAWIFFIMATLVLFSTYGKRDFNYWVVYISMVVLVTSLISGIYWAESIRVPAIGGVLVISLLLISLLHNKFEYHLLIKISTLVVGTVILGAWIAFIYTYLGGKAVYSVFDPSGRVLDLYVTTFTGSTRSLGNSLSVIRPAGIYDEPGAFSFVICIVAALRHMARHDKRVTWLILVFGSVSLSLAHVIYMLIHYIAEIIHTRKFTTLLLPIVILVPLLSFTYAGEVYNAIVLSRIEVTADGQIRGDNRTAQTQSNLNLLTMESVVWGVDGRCAFDVQACREKYADIGTSNPLTPIVRGGLVMSWPYYLVIVALCVLGLTHRRRFVLLGVALLLLQRPYVMSFGYAVLILLPLMYALLYVRHDRLIITRKMTGV